MTAHTPDPTTTPGLFDEPARVKILGQRKPRTTRPAAPRKTSPGEVVNDMDLIEAVLKLAKEPGYVVISDQGSTTAGTEDTVWRRRTRTGPEVDRAAADETLAVRQLLRQGLLTRGGFHVVSRGRHETRACSVLVPESTHKLSRRLGAYQRPVAWGPTRRDEQSTAEEIQ